MLPKSTMPRSGKTLDVHTFVQACFWERVDKHTGVFWNGTECWFWTGSHHNRYGRMKIGGRTHSVHRLAYGWQHGPIPKGAEVCHHCDHTFCVRGEHLFAGTTQDNSDDKFAKGRQRFLKGSATPVAVLTEAMVEDIAARLRKGETCMALGREHGVSYRTISEIKHGRNWRHVTGGAIACPPPPIWRGEQNGNAKLSPETVATIRARLSAGESGRKLAREYGVGQSTISRVKRGEHWGHVP
jgi:uncharacterized protein YerC